LHLYGKVALNIFKWLKLSAHDPISGKHLP
jgi:hypothetical protein